MRPNPAKSAENKNLGLQSLRGRRRKRLIKKANKKENPSSASLKNLGSNPGEFSTTC